MKGFSNQFKDLPDYILKITKEIWEDRGLSTLNHYYAEDLPMRFPSGLVRGNQNVINGTMATIAEFPDRQLLGEDVIWSGDEDAGFLSSHRLLTTGTHLGHGSFGAPTGRSFQIRAIADCAAKNDQIYDEWLIRDVSGIVKQLGMDVVAFTRDMIDREGGSEHCVKPFHPRDDVDGGYNSRGNDNEWGARLADILTRIMDKEFSVIPALYDRACHVYHAGDRHEISWAGADQLWLPLRSSFPSAKFEVHHVIGRHDPMLPPRAAVRWSLTGTHDGHGSFGAPTGAEVHVMGMTHAEFGPYGNDGRDWSLRHEFTLYDEVAIWKQILMHQG
ncbi:SnoaL-like protein [Litoreibacter ponti]|uniref:SnoaL-like protein n=1 Tax=Litoreibacter ponti TaxID=1510457 RepID=A0A2T6BHJ5_9RHOB|nr:ester cyclase [Litoreibacter ponti]PTX55530.1 SnoaL-like protein [Litoreibacter ponti]